VLRAAAAPLPRDMEATGQGLSRTRKKHTTTGARMPYATSSRARRAVRAGHLDLAVPLAGNPVLLSGGAAAELGQGRAGRSEAARRPGQTEMV